MPSYWPDARLIELLIKSAFSTGLMLFGGLFLLLYELEFRYLKDPSSIAFWAFITFLFGLCMVLARLWERYWPHTANWVGRQIKEPRERRERQQQQEREEAERQEMRQAKLKSIGDLIDGGLDHEEEMYLCDLVAAGFQEFVCDRTAHLSPYTANPKTLPPPNSLLVRDIIIRCEGSYPFDAWPYFIEDDVWELLNTKLKAKFPVLNEQGSKARARKKGPAA